GAVRRFLSLYTYDTRICRRLPTWRESGSVEIQTNARRSRAPTCTAHRADGLAFRNWVPYGSVSIRLSPHWESLLFACRSQYPDHAHRIHVQSRFCYRFRRGSRQLVRVAITGELRHQPCGRQAKASGSRAPTCTPHRVDGLYVSQSGSL